MLRKLRVRQKNYVLKKNVYSAVNIQKIMSNVTQGSLFQAEGGRTSRNCPRRPEQVTGNITFWIRGKFKTYSSKF